VGPIATVPLHTVIDSAVDPADRPVIHSFSVTALDPYVPILQPSRGTPKRFLTNHVNTASISSSERPCTFHRVHPPAAAAAAVDILTSNRVPMRSRCNELPNAANILLRLLPSIPPIGSSPEVSATTEPVHPFEEKGLASAASMSSASRHDLLGPLVAGLLASVSLQCEKCLDRHRWQKLSTNLHTNIRRAK
jgi:hypothetical protein